jgi:hypothetical protein
LFPKLKASLAGRKFGSNEEVIAATEAFFAELDEGTYREGITVLQHRWTKCINLRGDYIEK